MEQPTQVSNQGKTVILKFPKSSRLETPIFDCPEKEEDVVLKNQKLVVADKDIAKGKTLTLTLKILRPTSPIRYQIDDIMNKPLGNLNIDLSKIQHNKSLIDLIKKGKDTHGDIIIYSHIDPNIVFHRDTIFEFQCCICFFRWWATKYGFLNSKGCSWCKTKCLQTAKNSLYIVIFIGSRIHENKYDYSFNDPKTAISTDSILKIWCRKDNHKIFEEKVGKYLSRAKTSTEKSLGCPECNEEVKQAKKLLPKDIRKEWHHDLELLKSEGIRVHGNIYDYSLNNANEILNSRTKVKIRCLQIKNNGNPCLRVFEQKINSHIDQKAGCIECSGKLKYDYQIFMQRFNERYPDKPFLLHHIKEEDIINTNSMLSFECAKLGCKYIFKNTINEIINTHFRQCDRCNNREPWNQERLQNECNRKQSEGLYSYSLVNISESINSNSLLSIICNRCICKGYKNVVFEQTANYHFVHDGGCSRCNGAMPWTPERTKEECDLKEKFGQYSYENTDFSTIKGCDSLLLITCIYCKTEEFQDYIFSQTITAHFTQCSGCSRCGGSLKWTKKRFLIDSKRKEKEGLFSYENVDIETIDNCNTVIPISCINCKRSENELYIFSQSINNHFNNQTGCPKCNRSEHWTEQRCIKAAEEKNLEGHYSYNVAEFIHIKNGDSIININCLFCEKDGYDQHTFSYSVGDHFTNNYGCPRCRKILKWNYDRVLEELPRLPKSFTVFFDYSNIKSHMIENANSPLPITCLICNNPFRRTVAGHILRHEGCTYCKKSKGEKFIYNYLKINKIEFDDQTRVLGYNGNYFRYDFVINYRDITIVIEYDGIQHFQIRDYWQTQETFDEARKRDIYKQNVALKEGKKVIRIDYTIDFNQMEKYLKIALEYNGNIYYSTPSLYEWIK
jgi:hypothetical protein